MILHIDNLIIYNFFSLCWFIFANGNAIYNPNSQPNENLVFRCMNNDRYIIEEYGV